MSTKQQYLHIRIDAPTKAQLERLVAAQPETTLSSYIRTLIRKAAQEAAAKEGQS